MLGGFHKEAAHFAFAYLLASRGILYDFLCYLLGCHWNLFIDDHIINLIKHGRETAKVNGFIVAQNILRKNIFPVFGFGIPFILQRKFSSVDNNASCRLIEEILDFTYRFAIDQLMRDQMEIGIFHQLNCQRGPDLGFDIGNIFR